MLLDKMKKFNIFLMSAAALAMSFTSCKTNDTLADIVDVGQAVPTCYWEVGSTVCKAGESVTFHGKYTIPEGRTGDYSEIWYRIMRQETATATVGLAGSSLSYSKTYSSTDTVRAYQPIVRYAHSDAEWTGYQFEYDGVIPVSRTLSPVSWKEITTWDQTRFDSYYPQGFTTEFCEDVINLLTKDSTYYNALRAVYLNYPFTNEQFKEVNAKYGISLPDNIDMTTDDQGYSEKSDLWFSTTEAKDEYIVGYYYTTVENGNTIVHEVAKDATQTEGISYYPVYKSAAWIFCRYDDDLGSIISTVRQEYMPAFIELLGTISFGDWIYDSTAKIYKVDFARSYKLQTQFRVYDSEGEEGIANDVREISIN